MKIFIDGNLIFIHLNIDYKFLEFCWKNNNESNFHYHSYF